MRSIAFAAALCGAALGHALTLNVDLRSSRSHFDSRAQIVEAARQATRRLADLTARERAARGISGPITFPFTVETFRPPSRIPFGSSDITLQFDSSGPGTFPTAYQNYLQSVFTSARPVLNNLFGVPAEGGPVRVINYDATIGDRNAVSGGIYLHDNGSGDRVILFPIYQDVSGFKPEVTAVNFIHTLLLAYQAGHKAPSDGWQEGLVRASTMAVVRTPGALPSGNDPDLVEGVLEATYDLSSTYDWCNQKGLGGNQFIAPNLIDQALPVGGSVGGLYLMRFMMAGTAFQKVLVEYPTFAKQFNLLLYGTASSTLSFSQLRAMGQSALDSIGGSGSLVEGRSFSGWALNQFVLDPRTVPGQKLVLQPFPIIDGLSGTDFGVFAIQAHWFETKENGDETLLRDTAYPVFWTPSFSRFFATAQDDRMDIVQAYGSVVPNFTGSPFSGAPYRVTVDVPLQDKVARVYLPAGSIATADNPTPRDVYGCLTGVSDSGSGTISVTVRRGSQSFVLPVSHLAFGGITGFTTSGRLTFEVKRTEGSTSTTLLTRTVNKGPGPLAVNLHVDPVTSVSVPLSGGINMIGLPIQPLLSSPEDILGLSEGQVFAAKWNGLLGRYQFYPEVGPIEQTASYFTRSAFAQTRSVSGFSPSKTPIAVALRPGWNMVSNPTSESLNVSTLEVLTQSDFPTSYALAVGPVLGPDVFQYVPGALDAITGFSESGSMTSITQIPAGKAVWMRCTSANGAVVLFIPSGSRESNRTGPPPTVSGWSITARISAGRDVTELKFGAHPQASANADMAFDSPVPPSFGGLGARFSSGLFRDTRPMGPSGSYMIQLSNLVVGRTYTLSFSTERGAPPRFWVLDPAAMVRRRFQSPSGYTFVATQTSRQLQINTERTQ